MVIISYMVNEGKVKLTGRDEDGEMEMQVITWRRGRVRRRQKDKLYWQVTLLLRQRYGRRQ